MKHFIGYESAYTEMPFKTKGWKSLTSPFLGFCLLLYIWTSIYDLSTLKSSSKLFLGKSMDPKYHTFLQIGYMSKNFIVFFSFGAGLQNQEFHIYTNNVMQIFLLMVHNVYQTFHISA